MSVVSRRALVFSNLQTLNIDQLLACAEADIEKSTFVISNHGGPAASMLLTPSGGVHRPRPARIDWWLRYDPFRRKLPGCEVVERLQRRTNYLRITTLTVHIVANDPNSLRFYSEYARKCGPFVAHNFSSLLLGAAARAPQTFARSAERGFLGIPPSTGFVAALHALGSHAAGVPVVAVGFTGHCSQLDSRGHPNPSCRKIHDFDRELALLCAAGVRVGTLSPARCGNRCTVIRREYKLDSD